MTRFRRWLGGVSSNALFFVRVWWRPIICLSIGGTLIVNGVALPLLTKQQPDLLGLAACIGAASPFAWLRTVERLNKVPDAPAKGAP